MTNFATRIPHIALFLQVLVFRALLSACTASAADFPQHWSAYSDTSSFITGGVVFSETTLTMDNGTSLPLRRVAVRSNYKDDLDHAVNATIYQVIVPADPLLQRGNRLCGTDKHPISVTYIAVWAPQAYQGHDAPRAMAVFSSSSLPSSNGDKGFCRSYYYDADQRPQGLPTSAAPSLEQLLVQQSGNSATIYLAP